jgi:NADPH-dependent glutamate synthase beta chain and related oxidoreductases
MVYRTSSAHEEGGDRMFSVSTTEFVGHEGRLTGMRIVEVQMSDGRFEPVAGTERELPADYVFLAMGFTGPERSPMVEQFDLPLDDRGAIERADDYATDLDGIFVAGDAGRGQSLIVWAIAEGRAAAASVDRYLSGESNLPFPIPATARPLTV